MIFIFTLICENCGEEFEAKNGKAKYCKYCRNTAQANRNKEYMQRREANEIKPIGSKQICPLCNKEYMQKSGYQKCCPDCRHKQTNARKVINNAKYKNEHYEQINFSVPIGQRDELKAYAESQGLSLSKFIQTAIEEYKKNHE